LHLQVAAIRKAFGQQLALDDIGFEAGERDFVCLLGPSGCGKTTLLRIIAGLLDADAGRITLGGRDITHVPARERGFGIVFQSYSLFPHMTVAQNVGYGLSLRRTPRDTIAARCRELLELVQLPDAGAKYPAELSGGQQQRVALARALAVEPGLLLLDEPLSALDARVREQLRGEIRQVQRRLGIPTLMVTHDQDEAMELADTVLCMNRGRIEQAGSPSELYLRPRTRFVAQFVGASNLLDTAWMREHLPALLADRPAAADEAFEACVRPEDIVLHAEPNGAGRVTATRFLGSQVRLTVEWHGRMLTVDQHRDGAFVPGDAVAVAVRDGRCIWVSA
jgi:iron(III) transport system ATP-binding protein